jgi:hypothetical protein
MSDITDVIKVLAVLGGVVGAAIVGIMIATMGFTSDVIFVVVVLVSSVAVAIGIVAIGAAAVESIIPEVHPPINLVDQVANQSVEATVIVGTTVVIGSNARDHNGDIGDINDDDNEGANGDKMVMISKGLSLRANNNLPH